MRRLASAPRFYLAHQKSELTEIELTRHALRDHDTSGITPGRGGIVERDQPLTTRTSFVLRRSDSQFGPRRSWDLRARRTFDKRDS